MARRTIDRETRKAILAARRMVEACEKSDGNEAETRRRVERIFESVMGYDPLKHLSREHAIHGAGETEHVDFAVQLEAESTPVIMVELKRVTINLAQKHPKQVSSYAINAGCEWILLTNGRGRAGLPAVASGVSGHGATGHPCHSTLPCRRQPHLNYRQKSPLTRETTMAIWKLEPTNLESPDWQISSYRGRAIVRAPDATSSRRMAAEQFTRAARTPLIGRDSPASPWTNPELVTCTELHDSNFDPEGPAEVLDPLMWEPTKQH